MYKIQIPISRNNDLDTSLFRVPNVYHVFLYRITESGSVNIPVCANNLIRIHIQYGWNMRRLRQVFVRYKRWSSWQCGLEICPDINQILPLQIQHFSQNWFLISEKSICLQIILKYSQNNFMWSTPLFRHIFLPHFSVSIGVHTRVFGQFHLHLYYPYSKAISLWKIILYPRSSSQYFCIQVQIRPPESSRFL